ncbi:glycosyltransferase family protein [Simkania negevensis]|uniref:Uncharacterized protein n=1 Tax=Simkania negevensis (strain ATCC VR-1471 / DSM 27360 / Z) TaxID=331113 RepID=F8L461_SIMNZ|nr:hypothetical protein [Simkania negevensis]CCB90100.1 putative uncharacterized protein [Simkania negevensis Z]
MAGKRNNKPKKLLLITSSGGGGHIQAANAKAVKALSEDPNLEIIQKDILIDWVGRRFGKCFVHLWNVSQKKGNLRMLSFLSKNIPVADILFWVLIFIKALRTILREDVDRIIDTQPVGTSATIKALKVASRFTGKKIKLEKVITELPTEKVLHFFKPIKGLSQADRNLLRLVSTTPLLSADQTPDAFWQKNCKLQESEVLYEDFPLRATFEVFRQKLDAPIERMNIEIKVKNYIEKFLIADTIKRGNLHAEIFRDKIAITIEPTDKVSTILLGSQPTEEATIKYVKSFIEMANKAGDRGFRHLLFVFCNHEAEHRNSLLRRVHDAIQKFTDYPQYLNIIPMCFQGDEVIAPLYYRSDATFTRSGGLTSMELMTVAQGQIWIHSEIKGTLDREKLGNGMPIWERGNAHYLQEKKGAQFITPETFADFCSSYFMPESASSSLA